MRDQVLIEVRDRNLTRVGAIETQALDARLLIGYNTVGAWTIKLPQEHRLAPWLRAPGAGIVATWKPTGKVLLSGPTVNPTVERGPDDPSGLITVSGYSDDVILADAIGWGEPSNPDVESQTVGWDDRSGPAESVLRAYVSANIGPNAPPNRRPTWSFASHLHVLPDGHRGVGVQYRVRFKNLLEVCQEIATIGRLGFRIVQMDSDLVLEISEPQDKSSTVRLDIRNGTIGREEIAITPPTLTRVYVLGQGEGAQRQIVARTTVEAAQAEQAWGRVVERAIDQRQAEDLTELAQAGDEKLIDEGVTGVTANVVPSGEIPSMCLWEDFAPGDEISVTLDGQQLTANVTSVSVLITKDGAAQAIGIGDPAGFSAASVTASRTADTAQRVANLEMNAEAAAVGGPIDASRISGVLPLVTIPTLDASRIPSLNASKIGAGTLDPLRLPTWLQAKPPSPRHLKLNVGQTIAGDNTTTVVGVWGNAPNDGGQPSNQNDGLYYTANQVRVPVAGIYLVACGVCWDTGTASGYLYLDLRVNGASVDNALARAAAPQFQQNITAVLKLAAGDLLTVTVSQNSGATRNLANSWTHWSIGHIGPA